MTRYEGRYVTAEYPEDRQPSGWTAGCVMLAGAVIVGLVLGYLIGVNSAPRPVPSTTPRPEAVPEGSTAAWIGLQTAFITSPAPTRTSTAPTAVQPHHPALEQIAHAVRIAPERLERPVTGIASHMGHTEPDGYLALPSGPGTRVRICGKVGCVTRVSTDAGPSLAMQRAGRVADLSIYDFARVCGDPSAGLCRVTIARLR